ncbi:hypothetical protein GCM10022393_21870 [Aquimarina addita]|uniref:histidine kinase n=1 Tax=Aquimarina addita TaxID=870485 RepID=A0ABP6UK78_9FLAO
MIRQWFKNLSGKKHPHIADTQDEKDLIALINYLWNEVDLRHNTPDLKTKVDDFKSFSLENKIHYLPRIYLTLEDYLTQKNLIRRHTKQTIQNKVITDFKFAFQYKNFELIFDTLQGQEIALCSVFLSKVLDRSSELIGKLEDSEITEIKQSLHTDFNTVNSNFIAQRKQLMTFSSVLFSKIQQHLGKNLLSNIYLIVYKEQFESYHLLDSFTAILSVIPEGIFDKELINFPSKKQMLRMLQKQLFSLEEVNDKLTKEIIEREKIEDELKHSEQLKSNILETAMDGIILVNKHGIVLDWNKQAETILKVTKDEAKGKSIYPLVPAKLREELKTSIIDYINNGNGQLINKRVETSFFLKDKTIVYVELTIVAIKTKDDYLFNAFFRDITNKKIIENEIREAKVSAEKSAQVKSTFLSNMSHEIRTPLNVILGLSGILQKSDFTDISRDRENLHGIQFSAENLLVLVNDILDFSKIEAGKLIVNKVDFNIHELIKNLSKGFKIKADEKGLRYKVDIDPSLPKFIIGDQFRLNQILTNLLGNAIKFTQNGEVQISIQTKKEDDTTISIQFSVSDTGIGISTDKLNNIFESFYQVHKPATQKIEGTGLGLSISKQLIELQGGSLQAKSEINKGSRFEFAITFKKSKLKSSENLNQKTINSKHISKIEGMKVLVVEDNKMNQFFMKQVFSNWNIKIDIADNGKIALEKLDTKKYDLILMDMHMPIMDGPETAIHIRNSNDPEIKNIPIIACSADVFPVSKKIAIESGMNFYLTKPVSEKALEEILSSLQPFSLKSNTLLEEVETISYAIKANDIKEFCDFSILKQTFENDIEVIQSVLHIFIEETTQDFELLKNLVSKKEYIQAGEIAHKMKSSFKTLGINELSDMLQRIESDAKNGKDLNSISGIFNDIERLFPHVTKEVEKEIGILSTT